MSWNIKLTIISFFLFNFLTAQEKEENSSLFPYTEDPESVYFNIEGYYPVALGNSPYAEAYRLDPGFAVDFSWFITPKFTLGSRFAISKGYVEEPSKIGNISRTRFLLFGIDGGYYRPLSKDWNLHGKLGIGLQLNRHKAPEDHFSDDGGKTWASIEIARRLNRTIAFFLKTGIEYEFLHINSSQNVENYLNSNFLLNFGLGIRFNFQNPGG